MCDIEAVFYWVRVMECWGDMLQFLWWQNSDTSKEPQEYRITVHLFAAAFSLAYVNYTPKTTADDNEDELGFTPADLL